MSSDPTSTPPPSASRPPSDPGMAFTPPPPPPGYLPPMYGPPPRQRSVLARFALSALLSILVISVLMNLYLFGIMRALTAGPSESVYQQGDDTERRIVIIPIDGAIDDTMSSFVRSALRSLRDNPPAGLVLRVNSGGGGVNASDQIWHAVGEFRQYVKDAHGRDLPIIASFGGVAASGGYYVAAGSDQIFCEPTTITGSIGVLAQVPTFARTLEKLGVDMVVMEADGSPRKELANNPFRDWTEEDRQVVSDLLNSAYERFVEVVDQGRQGLDEQATREVASGAIYTAEEAVRLKLADRVGYLNDAVAQAAASAGLPADQTPHVTVLAPRSGLGLLGLLGASSRTPDAAAILEAADADRLWSLIDQVTAARLAYRAAWR